MTPTRCKACRAPIAFVRSEEGAIIPLDMRTPIFELVRDMVGDEVARPAERFYVSHFSVCPNADDFSASKRGKP